jgi:Uncharacterized proteins of PilT N-term./Vapc superfamily
LIIDTSSLVFGFANGKNIIEAALQRFPKMELLVSRSLIGELEGISTNKGKRGDAARLALLSIKAKKVKVDNKRGNVDDWVLETAANNRGSIVVTNDTQLIRRLDGAGVRSYRARESGTIG